MLNRAVAIALGLTSCVSDSGDRLVVLCMPDEPRDALDEFILGWKNDHPAWVEGNIGPAGQRALNLLLGDKTWAEVREDLWHKRPGGNQSVGYRFEVGGPWSKPDETLKEAEQFHPNVADRDHMEIETTFTDRAGEGCGSLHIRFTKIKAPDTGWCAYRIDNPNLGEVVRLIASCAER